MEQGSRFITCRFGSETFTNLVPCVDYRVQVLHHVAVDDLNDCLFVCATPNEIIYVLHIQFDDVAVSTYRMFISLMMDRCMTIDNLMQIPQEKLDFASDHNTINVWLKLSAAINRENSTRLQRNLPLLKPAHSIVPSAVSFWNSVKGGQDVVSRMLKNAKVDFRSLTPRAYIWIRMVSICLLNAHLLIKFLKVLHATVNHRQSIMYYSNLLMA